MTTRGLLFQWSLLTSLIPIMVGCASASHRPSPATTLISPEVGLAQPIGIALHPSGGLLRHPTDLAFSSDRRVLYIVDHGNNRLITLTIGQQGTSTWNVSPAR